MTSAVLQTGIRGIFLCLAALFPHFLFYGAAWVILLWYFFQYPKVEWNRMKTLGFFLLTAVGVLLECYVNPVLLKWMIKSL